MEELGHMDGGMDVGWMDGWMPRGKFELTADSLGAHMKVTESSPGMGHFELILRTFILLKVNSQDEFAVRLL